MNVPIWCYCNRMEAGRTTFFPFWSIQNPWAFIFDITTSTTDSLQYKNNTELELRFGERKKPRTMKGKKTCLLQRGSQITS